MLDNEVIGLAWVPMATSESRLLADALAWGKLGLSDQRHLPRRPEEIWGERNAPKGDHPHQFFARVCKAARCGEDRQTRVDLMAAMDLGVPASKCPINAGRLWRDVEQVCAKLNAAPA